MLKEPVISSMDSIEQIIFGEVMKKEEEIL